MNSYIVHNADGNIVSCGKSSELIDQRISENHVQLWMDFPSDIENYKIVSGSLVRISDAEIGQRELDLAWDLLKGTRESLLTASDWTQSPDSPLTDTKKQEWATYRQALRDLPANTTDPANPTWPTKPS